MNQKSKVLVGLVLVATVALASLLFLPGAPGLESKEKPESVITKNSSSPSAEIGTAMPAQENTASDSSQGIIDSMTELVVSEPSQGLQLVSKSLSHPDKDVRMAAVEASKQLELPEAAEVLRKAAETAISKDEKEAMLAAAEFIGLPPYQFKTGKQ
jgi:hypothetical protein